MGKVILICGKIGSGKTTYMHKLAIELNAMTLTQDEIMYGLFGKDLYYENREMYYKHATWVEAFVFRKAGEAAKSGATVLVDNGVWSAEERAMLRKFYADMGVICELHYLDTSEMQRRKNIQKRNAAILRGELNESVMEESDIDHDFDTPHDEEIDVRVLYES